VSITALLAEAQVRDSVKRNPTAMLDIARVLPNAVFFSQHVEKSLAQCVIIRFITVMDSETLEDQKSILPSPIIDRSNLTVEHLQFVPEEKVWLAGQLSAHTRRAYKQDVAHFILTMGIKSADQLRKVSRAAVVAWQNAMVDERAKPRTIRRRLSALSSLFAHLVAHGCADENPVREIKRPRVNRRQGTTRAFSTREARMILDAPGSTTLRGLRDRAILSVGFQAGPRRSEIASLLVKDFHNNAGYKSLHLIRKGGEDLSLALNPQTAQRIEEYLAAAGHGDDSNGPLFRPVGVPNPRKPRRRKSRRHLHPEAIDRILRKYAARAGAGFSAHSMRATFITTALDKGASLEDVQRDVGHVDPSTTKLYDRRGYNPERSAAFFATY
jgi:site-specific recombinase XerD